MKFIVRFALAIVLAVLGGTSSASAQAAINIADLILAVRQGLIEAQQRESKANLVPMFLVKDFEMTITLSSRKPQLEALRSRLSPWVRTSRRSKHKR